MQGLAILIGGGDGAHVSFEIMGLSSSWAPQQPIGDVARGGLVA